MPSRRIGVFGLDSMKRVVLSNAAGERLLGDGLDLVEGRLRLARSVRRGEAESAIARAVRGDPKALIDEPKPIPIDRSRTARPMTLYALPVRKFLGAGNEALSQVRAIVLLIDSSADEAADPAIVRDVLGLTLGEARIAALIGSGLAPRAAAEKLGVTEETARTVLKRVFSKVGVSRQSELVALMARLILR